MRPNSNMFRGICVAGRDIGRFNLTNKKVIITVYGEQQQKIKGVG